MPDVLPADVAITCQRAVKAWINTCPVLPDELPVTFEDLPANDTGICFASTQGARYADRYILGGYKAQYDFQIIYRVLPTDDGDMLDAVERLAAVAAWAATATPPTISGAVNVKVKQTSDTGILNAFEDGTNDYAVSLNITWEVF